MPDTSTDITIRTTRIATVAAGLAVALGIFVLVGWVLDIDALRRVFPGPYIVLPNTATCILAGGISLLLRLHRNEDPRARRASVALAALVCAIGLLTVIEYATGADLWIDLVLFAERVSRYPYQPPGRMAPNSALAFSVLGAAMLLLHRRADGRWPLATTLATAGLTIGVVALIGYLYGAHPLYAIDRASGMSLGTALGLSALSLGVLFARPGRSGVALLLSRGTEGILARELMLAALLVPLFLGWVFMRLRGEELVSREGGVSLFVVAVSALLVTLVLRGANLVRDGNAQREQMLGRELEARNEAERARVRAEQAEARAARLQRATEAFANASTADEALATLIAREGAAALGATSAAVALHDERQQRLEVIGALNVPEPITRDGWLLPIDNRTPVAEATRTGELVVARDPGEIRARFPEAAPAFERVGVQSLIAAPLAARDHTFGALVLRFPTPRAFPREERDFVRTLGRIAADAVARARLHEAERRARAAAEEASRAKSDFLATMSHELRTPLNAILGYSSLLTEGIPEPATPAQRAQLARIGVSAQHLLVLIDEVLTLSRLESGHENVRPSWCSLRVLAEETAVMIEPMARQKGLRFEWSTPAEALTVETDAPRVRQALINLLTNAVKFTEDGSVTLTVREEGDDAFAFVIEDTGIGIASEHLERVFESFWQVEQSTTRRVGGAGLGLAVTRRLARLLGGEVSVASTPGEGSTFVLRLPRRWHGSRIGEEPVTLQPT